MLHSVVQHNIKRCKYAKETLPVLNSKFAEAVSAPAAALAARPRWTDPAPRGRTGSRRRRACAPGPTRPSATSCRPPPPPPPPAAPARPSYPQPPGGYACTCPRLNRPPARSSRTPLPLPPPAAPARTAHHHYRRVCMHMPQVPHGHQLQRAAHHRRCCRQPHLPDTRYHGCIHVHVCSRPNWAASHAMPLPPPVTPAVQKSHALHVGLINASSCSVTAVG